MKDLIIIGAGGLGREVLDLALVIQKTDPSVPWRVKGFITDYPGDFHEKNTGGYDIIGRIDDHVIEENNVYVFAIADIPFKRKTTKEFIERGAEFVNLVHPTAGISKKAKIGVGNIFQFYSGVSPDVEIGDFVMVNAFTTIGHDAKIGSYCTLSAHCGVNGHTELAEGVFLGSHAVICPWAKVGENAVVGAGSVVLKRVKANTTVFGVPAKRIDI